MSIQNYSKIDLEIMTRFMEMKNSNPDSFIKRLNLSWSNWGFGMETLEESAKRLKMAGIGFIELHGNHYGKDLGYKPNEVLEILGRYGIKVSGICGMFSTDNDLSSNKGIQRQAAIDYIRREIDFAAAVDADYMLVVPAAVGRSAKYDDSELIRSVESLKIVADEFAKNGIKAAIEPIRSAETSLIHTIKEAKVYINLIENKGVSHINGDVYHMQVEESHIGAAILDAGDMLTNLHMADSNRCALGEGSLDLDTIIMALYLIGYNTEGRYVTPEPLGPGGDPYPAMHAKPDKDALDHLVMQTSVYFREREQAMMDL
jgi:D-psicose/D-tagatose/L-ribulose 3-epimerase